MRKLRPWLPVLFAMLTLVICIWEQWMLARRFREPRTQRGVPLTVDSRKLPGGIPAAGDTAWLKEFGRLLTMDDLQRGVTALAARSTPPKNASVLSLYVQRLAFLDQNSAPPGGELTDAQDRLARSLIDLTAVLSEDQLQQLRQFREERRQRQNIETRLTQTYNVLASEGEKP